MSLKIVSVEIAVQDGDQERVQNELNALQLGVYSFGVTVRPATPREEQEVHSQVPQEIIQFE